ncbi:MAG TPA: hypothetical protein PKU97_17760 [Kofleriaceae bacterium]|nr:hypothetical protein [Kofleriaceae bacterium]
MCLGSATVAIPQTTLSPGTGGAGGSGRIPGAPGLAVPVKDCAIF